MKKFDLALRKPKVKELFSDDNYGYFQGHEVWGVRVYTIGNWQRVLVRVLSQMEVISNRK